MVEKIVGVKKKGKAEIAAEEKEAAKTRKKAEEKEKERIIQATFYQPIRDRLKKTIELKGMSQEKLASKCGVTQPTICKILTGPDKPDLHLFVAICKELDLNPDEVLSVKQSAYDKVNKNESIFAVDAMHDYFQGYLGTYYAYFYSTENKGSIHNGIFRIYKDRYSNQCLASFSFETGEDKNNKPVVKQFVGKVKLSMKLGALCCEMVAKDASGDVSYIIFNHKYLINKQCECRLGMTITICAGLSRLPVAHKFLISRQELTEEDLYYIDGQLKLNDNTIQISEKMYKSFTEDTKLPDTIRNLIEDGKDFIIANAEKEYFYTINEDDIDNRKNITEEDKAKVVNLLRKYSNSKRCKKIGPKGENFVFEYLKKKKKSDAKQIK